MKGTNLPKTRVLKTAVAMSTAVLIVGAVYLARFNYLNGQIGQYFSPPFFLEIGDSWKLNLTANENEYNLTMTVIGEETIFKLRCYTVKLTFEPESPFAEQGMSNEMTAWLEKSTLNIMKLEGKGSEGYGFTYVEEHSYTFQGQPSLTVGNEHNETDTREMNVYGLPPFNFRYMHEKTTTTKRIKVEAFENITVPAGTFSCYKIVTYDKTGQKALSIRWVSMEAKTAVRTENYKTGEFEIFETTELLSYSIQQLP